ncbi:MAG: hypothetical protein SGJ20_10100 [Planctomycetota bacterium]|nr:hypothetical protein [Planctomycetota bacterium]
MRKLMAALVIAVFSVGDPIASTAQAQFVQIKALPEASRAVIDTWLQRDCYLGPSEGELSRLRTLSGVAQGVLVEAYEQGPPPELKRHYESAFSAAYDARSNALAREGERLFGAENTANLKDVDRGTYVQHRLEAARINYRTNAVLGLGLVGARSALPLLNRIAAEPTNPMRQAARNSISALEEGQKSPAQKSP